MTTMSNLGTVDDARPEPSIQVDRPTGRPWLDRIGVGASVACAIHCMAAPLLLVALPTAGSVWAHPLVHWLLAVLVLPLALWVIYCGYRKHAKKLTLIAAGLGSLMIIAGLILPMTGTGLGISTSLPEWLGNGLASTSVEADADHAACTDTCCPSVAQNVQTGGHSLMIPAGSLTTLIGSLLLFLAHATNLLACRRFSSHSDAANPSGSDCGCPSGVC